MIDYNLIECCTQIICVTSLKHLFVLHLSQLKNSGTPFLGMLHADFKENKETKMKANLSSKIPRKKRYDSHHLKSKNSLTF